MDGSIAAIIIISAFLVLFIILGIILMNGKGAFLIAGYNTMPPEEKEKFDIISLSKFMGKMMFVLSFSLLCWIASIAYAIYFLFIVGIIIFIGAIIFMLIYMNTGNRFKKHL